ncbi:MAG TPA: lysozyme inhibitor LprI family protein [Rhizomicrobium sp.]
MRLVWVCFFLSLCAGLGAASAAGLPVAARALVFKSKALEISVRYPQTANRAIDAALADYARASVDAFKTYGPDAAANGDRPYALDTTYSIARNDGAMFAVLFTIYEDTGGAHPNGDYATFDFLLPGGAQVFLPEIIDGSRGLTRVSRLVAADLLRRIGSGADALSDKDTIARGTAPVADNFKDFVWEPGRLHIYFPPYQVAAYAAGPQESILPLDRLREVIRPDWRAPAPSFDCAKAATGIETAVCADAALARLDRQVAEAWQSAMRNAYEPAAQAKLRQEQRDWLARRNAACRGPAPGACLVKVYRDRLAVLTRPPV